MRVGGGGGGVSYTLPYIYIYLFIFWLIKDNSGSRSRRGERWAASRPSPLPGESADKKRHRALISEDNPFATTQVHPKGPGVDFPAFFLGCPSAVADHALTCWMALKRGTPVTRRAVARLQSLDHVPYGTIIRGTHFRDSLFGKENRIKIRVGISRL